MRNETRYDQFLGWTKDGTAIVLNYTFEHSDGFKGATGGEYALISYDEWEHATTDEALREYYLDIWREDAGSPNGTELGLTEWIEFNQTELIESQWSNDLPEGILPDRNQWGVDCIGAGRIFPEALDRIVEWDEHGKELKKIILEAERSS